MLPFCLFTRKIQHYINGKKQARLIKDLQKFREGKAKKRRLSEAHFRVPFGYTDVAESFFSEA